MEKLTQLTCCLPLTSNLYHMKSARHLLPLFVLICLFSCGPNPVEENQKLRDEVIAVHDEVMPLMGKLKSLEKEALAEIDSISILEEVDEERIEALRSLASDLNQAYEGMFVWMRQYDREDGEQTPEEVRSYLEDQMILVTKVNEDITKALAKSDELLGN